MKRIIVYMRNRGAAFWKKEMFCDGQYKLDLWEFLTGENFNWFLLLCDAYNYNVDAYVSNV